MLSLVQFIRQITPPGKMEKATDGQLLERFISQRDEVAFATLLRRHGPLVFAVCRRALPHVQDAEDAFQATFLVLARNAGTIAKRGSVASWLHGVARRIAQRAKADLAKRRVRDRQASLLVAPDSLDELVRHDLRSILDEEVARLPAKYRDAFILCYLEGKTNDEAASLLGCPRGTVSSRLVRAREILRTRLSRRGLLVSAAFVTTMLPRATAAAVVPGKLTGTTLRAALQIGASNLADAGFVTVRVATLMEGVLKAMAMTKFKIGALFLTLGVALAGAGAVTIGQEAADPATIAEEHGKTRMTASPGNPPDLTQEPDRATEQAKAEPPIDPVMKYLALCEQRLNSLNSLLAAVQRTSSDKTFQVTEAHEGTFKYLKPNLSMLELHVRGKPERFEKYVWAGKFLYEYSPTDKEIRVHNTSLPNAPLRKFLDWAGPPYSWFLEPGPVPLSPILKVDRTKRLFALKLVKEDQWYAYIELQARTPEAKDVFQRARIVLLKPSYLPREIWFEQRNGNEVKWDITRIEENVSLPQKEFTAPQVPPGWILRRLPQANIEKPSSKEVPPPDRP